MIAVTGANGQLGRHVIEHLLEHTSADSIVALVRSPERASDLSAKGIHVRHADYDQPETLTKALQGVDKLLLISSSEVGKRAIQHQAVIDAATAANLELLVYTSLLKTAESPMVLAAEHKITEAAIKASKLPAVILRNGWYTENYTANLAAVLETGVVAGAAKQGKYHTATRNDYALAAAKVLLDGSAHSGKTYELAGDQGFTLAEYAAEIAKQSGKNIAYQDMTASDYAALLVQIGLPSEFADVLADSDVAASSGWLEDNSKTLSTLIGRPTTAISTSITQALQS